jgi:hypothetical protein
VRYTIERHEGLRPGGGDRLPVKPRHSIFSMGHTNSHNVSATFRRAEKPDQSSGILGATRRRLPSRVMPRIHSIAARCIQAVVCIAIKAKTRPKPHGRTPKRAICELWQRSLVTGRQIGSAFANLRHDLMIANEKPPSSRYDRVTGWKSRLQASRVTGKAIAFSSGRRCNGNTRGGLRVTYCCAARLVACCSRR